MRDYHAVKEANIEIAGLTVVGGVNGCGKSTIARWLNYVVNVLNNYDEYVIRQAKSEYNELLHILTRATTVSAPLRIEWFKDNNRSIESGSLEEMDNTFSTLIGRFTNILRTKLNHRVWDMNRRRLSFLFDLDEKEGESLADFVNRLEEYMGVQGQKIYENANTLQNNHTFKNWKNILFDKIDLSIDDSKIDISFMEDEVELLRDKTFSIPLMLHNAVYINTQDISAAIGEPQQKNGNFSDLLQRKSDNDSSRSRVLTRMIRKIIAGDVVIDPQANSYKSSRDMLHYISNTGLDILLRGAATGIISFSILLQLLENGWITENTLLIIDEPEAHLHPQWIVEYARILVKINKILGTKIFISTHNPDMLAALQAISGNEGTLPQTLFYIAEKDTCGIQYVYRNLGHNIGPIFDSFNIALDRIELYGAEKPLSGVASDSE